jgi:large subunit ribosomal protein L25
MKSVPLTAYSRSLNGRGGAKKLRSKGRVPAVIYGGQGPAQSLEINGKELENLIHHGASENLLVDLALTGDPRPKRLALVQEVQHHPLSGHVLHLDLHEVSETEKVTIMVPVEPIGEAVGVKTAGGVLEHVLFKIRVRALPKDLPEVLHVDVSHLEIGKAVHLGDIKPPAGVEILGDKNVSVLAVAAPITEAEEAAATEAAAAPGEVEMIKEKKEDGTEVAPAGGKAEGKAPAGKAEAKAPAGKADAKAAEKAPDKGADKGAEKKPEKKK